MPKYKLPKKERGFDGIDSINQSSSELVASTPERDDMNPISRRALGRKFEEVGIKEDEEKFDIFGAPIPINEDHPKMRYSIQETKNPIYSDDQTNLDDRRIASEPDLKYKDYESHPKNNNSRLDDFISQIKAGKSLLSNPKEEKKDTERSLNPYEDPSDLNKTEDKPSLEEDKKIDFTEENDGFTQYQNTEEKTLDNLNKTLQENGGTDQNKDVSPEESRSVIPEDEKDENPSEEGKEDLLSLEDAQKKLGTDGDQSSLEGDNNLIFAGVNGDTGHKINDSPEGDQEDHPEGDQEDHPKGDQEGQAEGDEEHPEIAKEDHPEGDHEIQEKADQDKSPEETSEKDSFSPKEVQQSSEEPEKKDSGLLNQDDSRNGDLTQDKLMNNDENIYDDPQPQEIEKALDPDGSDNDSDNLDEMNEEALKRTISEKEQPLDEVIRRNEEIIGAPGPIKTTRSENDSRIHHASDDRGSKETTNGVLETPPPDDSDEFEADIAAVEVNPKNAKPRVFYSNKSESSVESMMADTPSNYNILNGRFDEKKGSKGMPPRSMLDKYNAGSQRGKPSLQKGLDVISEVPSKPPSNLNTIKHVKTTKNERTFVDSVVGSEKNSYMGDGVVASHAGRIADSDKGPLSDHNQSQKTYDIRNNKPSSITAKYPISTLEQSKKLHRDLKFNQFMASNKDSELNSANGGYENKSNEESKNSKADPELKNELRYGLPPIRYPKPKKKTTAKPEWKVKKGSKASLANLNDLEAAYLSNR